jgi:hypothetical protein
MSIRGRTIPRLLAILATAALLFAGLAVTTPAQAAECTVPTDEVTFINNPACTNTSIVDIHKVKSSVNLLSKDDLLRHADLYAQYGFSREWFEKAWEDTITVTPGTRWTGCRSAVGTGNDGLCPDHGLTAVEITSVITAGEQIHVFTDGTNWIARMCGNFVYLGTEIPEPDIDVEKVAFDVNAPAQIPADTDVEITVRSTVRNNGPITPSLPAVDVTTVTSHSPDCTVTPASQSTNVTVPAGQLVTWDSRFTVRCADPSFHHVSFRNDLSSPHGYRELNLANQSRTTTWNPEVLDKSDIAVSETSLTCSPETMVGDSFTCTGSVLVTNHGPHGTKPENTQTKLELTPQSDCTITAANGTVQDKPLTAGESVRQEATWTLACAKRSDHETTLTAEAFLHNADIHVSDPNPNNNHATAKANTEVFEEVDLETTVLDLQCTEREHNTQSSECTATVRITNNGPADQVITDTDLRFAVEGSCTAMPAEQTQQHVLAAGSSHDLTFATRITCDTAQRHKVAAYATLQNASSDPHAVDKDEDHLVWTPVDLKPRSLPSAVNINKQGLTPFAILATAEFDPLTQIDTGSLTFGATGTEQSGVVCSRGGEDVNDDGRPDLVCHAEARLTAVTCDTTTMAVQGLLLDGQRFVGQDAVKVVPCKKR